MKFTINTNHSTFELKGNVILVAQWVFRWPWNSIVPCSYHTAAKGNSERIVACISCAFWKLNQFSKRVIFDKYYTCIMSKGTARFKAGTFRFETASLPTDLLMFSIHRLKKGPFVCKCMTYLQSMIYFQTELLTRAKFSRHVWTGFLWSHRWWKVVLSQIFVNTIIRNWINPSVSGFADTAGAV